MQMAYRGSSVFFLLLTLVASLSRGSASPAREVRPQISRSSFPAGFIFGTASSAYQLEGAASEGGRGPSIWDTFTHKYPEKIKDGSNGDVAIDAYHRYKEDVRLMKELGLDAYRFSISWSRILPNGRPSGGVNKEGVRYYNNLINELISNGMQPFATLFHWDFPQALEDEYGGFLSDHVIADFRNYADICFKEFGDRVKHWVTFNEPWTYSGGGYAAGNLAPGRCSSWFGNCTGGDSGTEPYIVTHNQLLSHAAAVKQYREKYQASQNGIIGITNLVHWILPSSSEKSNGAAAQRAIDFMFGMFMDPLAQGEYPKSMRSLVGKRLPRFTKEESLMVNGSFDFIGINYYTAYYATNVPLSNAVNASFYTDSRASLSGARNGITIGSQAASAWLYVYPRGLRDLLIYTKKRYNNPLIYITENGIDELNNENLSLEEALEDDMRIEYYRQHLFFLQKAIREGVNVKGYFAWSLFDNFEWGDGFTVRFGINYVDYKDGLKRYPKHSALWFKKLLKK